MTTESIAPTIDLSGNVAQFFRAVLNDAIEEHGVQADDATETYLVALLADYTRPDQLSGETLSRPLTLLLDEALQAAGYDRFERLRSLGDGVLYVSGFFGDHLKNRGVALDYVSSLGARAYDNAAQMLRVGTSGGGTDAAPDVFSDLAERFADYVRLLRAVADDLLARSARTNKAAIDVYERWLRTGSSSLAKALTSRGWMPVRTRNGALH